MALREYFQCPMCGWCRPKNFGMSPKTRTERVVRFDKVDVSSVPVWQLREIHGAGRGSKDAVIRTVEKKTLGQLPQEIKDQIAAQCNAILNELMFGEGEET